jgi:hypothetical protein
MIKFYSLSLSTLLISGCAAPIADFVVPAGVRKDAAEIVSFTKADETLLEAKAKIETRVSGNLGIVWRFSQNLQTRITSDGLTDDLTITEASDGRKNPSSTMRTLSVCGLIPLLYESASGGMAGQLHFVPTSNSVSVVSTGAAMPISQKVRMNAFKTDTKSICNPTNGMTFTYQVSGHTEVTGHGPIGTLRTVFEFIDTVTCTNSSLDSSLTSLEQIGATILTKCNNPKGVDYRFRATEMEYVFFPKLGRYLQIYRKAPGIEEKFDYATLKVTPKLLK